MVKYSEIDDRVPILSGEHPTALAGLCAQVAMQANRSSIIWKGAVY
ncbi:hypothetical protein [Shewanella youngdeokensis]|uniref:Uncharacterized protein n=1 Tax=Shewanella youngdeokensis TaxID=2999068 RepID=A0ABZ0K2Y2_9GAMM|nr:hypothetical protein RGE70_04700 [Shewanella sp. DAU334]